MYSYFSENVTIKYSVLIRYCYSFILSDIQYLSDSDDVNEFRSDKQIELLDNIQVYMDLSAEYPYLLDSDNPKQIQIRITDNRYHLD